MQKTTEYAKITTQQTRLPERLKSMTMSESAALFQQEFGPSGDPEAVINAMMDAH